MSNEDTAPNILPAMRVADVIARAQHILNLRGMPPYSNSKLGSPYGSFDDDEVEIISEFVWYWLPYLKQPNAAGQENKAGATPSGVELTASDSDSSSRRLPNNPDPAAYTALAALKELVCLKNIKEKLDAEPGAPGWMEAKMDYELKKDRAWVVARSIVGT